MDYDKIYQILKYDIVTPFVVGGAGRENNMPYAVIKLLEIKFRTTLGYPSKLCNSANIYACYADERASEWMKYLEDNKLVKLHHTEPLSFSYNNYQ